MMADFSEINKSRKLLGLGEMVTLKEIKKAYRKLALRHHPDRCESKKRKEHEEIFKKINHAYEMLMAYCSAYCYSFEKDDVEKVSPDEEFREYLKRFYGEWWGDPKL